MWREFIQNISEDCVFAEPASEMDILSVERSVGRRLPRNLADLLRESNGVETGDGDELIYSCQGIRGEHEVTSSDPIFRENFMPFDGLLFFARDCGGNLFGYAVHDGSTSDRSCIFYWDHEDDSRMNVASSLEEYLARRLRGEYDQSGEMPTEASQHD